MRSGRGPFLISIIVIILLIQMIPETEAYSWDGIYRSSDAKPWKIWHRDPQNIQSMEIDPGNRTLYIGCENGLIIKDLETGAYTVIDQYDGLNPLKAPLVSDIELDLLNERIFFVLQYGTEVYELNTVSREISCIHRFDATTTLFKYGRSMALEYDGIHDILFFARDSGLMVFDMGSNDYRFHDFINFDVRLSNYTVTENSVEVVMDDSPDNLFAISDIELCPSGERLFISANTGLFSYYRSMEIIYKDINKSEFGRPVRDLLYVSDLGKLILAGQKVWAFDLVTNLTSVVYEDLIERDNEGDDLLKLLWLESNFTLVISSGQGPALIFHNWKSGKNSYSTWGRMLVENAQYHYSSYDLATGHFTEMGIDPISGKLLLTNGDIDYVGFKWKVKYFLDGSIITENYTNIYQFLKINKYSFFKKLDVKERSFFRSESHGSNCGELFLYDIQYGGIRSITILDYFTNYDRMAESNILSLDNRLILAVERSLWDLNLDNGNLKQEIFWYFEEEYGFHQKRRITNIIETENGIMVTLTNSSIYYDLEKGSREFNPNIVINNTYNIGPVSGHYFYHSNRKGEIIEYDLVTGETWIHFYNISNPYTRELEWIEYFCLNSNETLALIGSFNNITILDMRTGELWDENFLEDLSCHMNYGFTEIFYHEKSNFFIGIDEHFMVCDILGRRAIGKLDQSTFSDYVIDNNGSIYGVTGPTWWGDIGYSSEGLNGLVSFDPYSCEYRCYTENIGLPGINCMGLALNEERNLIIVAGEEYIAAVRIEDLENEPETKEIPVNEVLSRTHPIPDELLGIDPKDKIEYYENVYVIGAVGLGTLSFIGISIILFEPLKFKILSLIVFPLFSKVKEEEILGNRKRKDIYDLIRRYPDIHLNAIRKQLSLSPGEAVYHLRVLEREDKIRSESRGVKKIFFITGAKRGRDEFNRSRLQNMIIDIISKEPGISQREISRRLNRAPSTINYNVRFLADNRSIRIERRGRFSRCFKI